MIHKYYILILVITIFYYYKKKNRESFHSYNEIYLPLEIRQMKQLKRFNLMQNYKIKWKLIKRLLTDKDENNKTYNYIKKNINLISKFGYTLLSSASLDKEVEVVKLLLDHDADPNVNLSNGLTALHNANHEYIVHLLADKGGKINKKDRNGNTPLMLACYRGDKNVVFAMIESGAYLNEKNNEGITPLMIAAKNNNVKIIDILIKNLANINLTDKEGNSAFIWASKEKSFDAIRFLYYKGININHQNNLGNTGAHYIDDAFIYQFFINNEQNPKRYLDNRKLKKLKKMKKYINTKNDEGRFQLWHLNNFKRYSYENVFKNYKVKALFNKIILITVGVIGFVLLIYSIIKLLREKFDFGNIDYESFSRKDIKKILDLDIKNINF
jgi:ankyrin repeat protein